MEDEFLDYMDSILKFASEDLFADSFDKLQIKMLKQLREKYIEIKIKNLENDIQTYRRRNTILL